MKYFRLAGLLGFGLAAALSAGAASATTWPAKIVGTYNGYANTSTVQITISSQATGSPCAAIAGSFLDTGTGASNSIQGYYCPKSGAIAFLRQNTSNGSTFQVYRGAFAMQVARQANTLTGNFGEYDEVGNLGEYPFTVVK